MKPSPEELSPNAPVRVAIALVWKAGQLLVTRRPTGTHLAGYWEFPGGKRQRDETPERCAEREVLEETAITCRAARCRSPIVHVYPERTVEIVAVDCDWLSGAGTCLGVTELRWIAPSALGELTFPAANVELIQELIRSARS